MNNKLEFINVYEWGIGSYKLNLHLPIELKQFFTTSDALSQGYLPHGNPISRELASQNFEYCKKDNLGNKQIIADLFFDEFDLPFFSSPDAYVIGATYILERSPRKNGGPMGEYFRIMMQFYRKA